MGLLLFNSDPNRPLTNNLLKPNYLPTNYLKHPLILGPI